MAEVGAVKLCTQKDYIKSCQMDDKSPPKGTWLGQRDTFFACAIVDLAKFCHSTPLSEINNAVDGGYLLLAPTTTNASNAIH